MTDLPNFTPDKAMHLKDNEDTARDQILSKTAVATWLGVSQSTIDRWSQAGRFPPKLRLGPARVGWSRNAVADWIAALATTGND